MITQEQIQILYEKYLNIVKLEVSEFGCKPTEVRHLIGRIGEFYCALHVNGSLSHEANQHGFDVVSKVITLIAVVGLIVKKLDYNIEKLKKVISIRKPLYSEALASE